MTMRSLTALSLAAIWLSGCDKIPFIGGKSQSAADSAAVTDTSEAPPATPAATEPEPVAEEAPAPTFTPPTPRQAPAPRRTGPAAPTLASVATGETPWVPTRTGTIDPGMTSQEVINIWGDPVVRRSAGRWTYLYYRNGCEHRCGTFDVVILEDDQVVDAIVRGPGHQYSGISSSPPDAPVRFTPPDSNLTLGVNG